MAGRALRDRLPQAHLPERNEPSCPPPHKLLVQEVPRDVGVYQVARAAVGERAEDLEMPPENLLQPALLRHWV